LAIESPSALAFCCLLFHSLSGLFVNCSRVLLSSIQFTFPTKPSSTLAFCCLLFHSLPGLAVKQPVQVPVCSRVLLSSVFCLLFFFYSQPTSPSACLLLCSPALSFCCLLFPTNLRLLSTVHFALHKQSRTKYSQMDIAIHTRTLGKNSSLISMLPNHPDMKTTTYTDQQPINDLLRRRFLVILLLSTSLQNNSPALYHRPCLLRHHLPFHPLP